MHLVSVVRVNRVRGTGMNLVIRFSIDIRSIVVNLARTCPCCSVVVVLVVPWDLRRWVC